MIDNSFEMDSWYLGHLKRLLNEPIPDPILPEGFAIRPLRGAGEIPEIVSVQQKAFESKFKTEVWRQQIMKMPE